MKKGRNRRGSLGKRGFIRGIIFTVLAIGILGAADSVVAVENNKELDTPAGIDFYRKEESTTPTTSESKTEPSIPENPTIKKSGRLPMTGELLQPIIFLILGWLLFLLAMCLYLAYKNRKKGVE